jgi:hypothetical protein
VAATSNPRDIGSDTTLKEFRITGPFRVQSALADFGTVARDDCFTSITGLGNYFFDYKLLPITANDVVKAADTSSCLYETEAADCDDGMDNDFDGFADCVDFSCQGANPVLCTVDGSVVEIQDGTIAENSRVALTGVVVTAVSADTIDLWVQDAGSSADYNGLHVFRGDGASMLTLAVGDTVDMAGVVSEFFEETELHVDRDLADVTVTGTAAVTVKTGLTSSQLSDAVGAEPYEGMLVEIADVPVVLMNDGFGNFTVGITGETLNVDNELYEFPLPAKGTCYATITGISAYAFSERKLYPRDANDLVTGGTCP